MLWCGLRLGSRYVFSGASPEKLPGWPVSGLPVTGLGLPGSSYKAMCNWLLPVLDLETCGGGLTVNQGQLPLAVGLGQLSKMPSVALGLLPPVSCP